MFSAVLKKAAKGVRVVPPSKVTLDFLKKHRVAPRLITQLKACSVSDFMAVGHLTLYPFLAIPKHNGKPNQHALRNGFLVIGCGLNGDPIAVELVLAQRDRDGVIEL